METFEPVIGLEVHCQLLTESKIFSASSARFEPRPNHAIDTYCIGLPGVLPKLNRAVVLLGLKAGLALECRIRQQSIFARKHYFYPDLPKGYQISQYDRPLAEHGRLEVDTDDGDTRVVSIVRIHLEEDAGKNVHDEASSFTKLDYNRSGVPLAEIVTGPDLRSAGEAARAFRTLHGILVAIGVCDGNMQEGSLRADANVSIRPKGREAFGTRTEIKNLNSFRFLEQAVESEILRQARLVIEGGSVTQETRLFDSVKKVTRTMRSKEEAHDYRYFPDPDLPPLDIPESWIEEARSSLPELPRAAARRYRELGLGAEVASLFSEDRRVSAFFDQAIGHWPLGAVPIANLVRGEILRELKDSAVETPIRIRPSDAAELSRAKEEGRISSTQLKKIFVAMWHESKSLESTLAEEGSQVADSSTLEPVVAELVSAFPKERVEYQKGKTKLISFFIGQAMKRTGGKASPEVLRDLLIRHLGGPTS
ncbi:MAG: Asp-tRNA(Asn)/Glu-tRNA(Gln) amidotransferase subunit GatB [Deltaproteobacteria bacterium]|nr:Asp-tRNA(Asn)/Glu-tRNA(Gln) amidotransferase subunit GatB [Deltaproteobacteria bacterium]